MTNEQQSFEFDKRPTIKGFPELRWTGKRPYESTVYYPAQLKERYGKEHVGGPNDGWINKIYWGDNLQVMSHMLSEYRGKVDLIYIDPPFDSKADYKKKISLRGKTVTNDSSSFEEKQYGDIWTNDEYLQFMYERLILCRELLSNSGSLYLHCDWHKGHHLRLLLDEVFGGQNFQNEIIWRYSGWNKRNNNYFSRRHDAIFYYSKSASPFFEPYREQWESTEAYAKARKQKIHIDEETGREYVLSDGGAGTRVKRFLDEAMADGRNIDDVWLIDKLNNSGKEGLNYPTQKPERLIERIVSSSAPKGGLVFDCFMGSGTTQAVAMKLGRRFIGADINLGAVQTTTKRLIKVAGKLDRESQADLLTSDSKTNNSKFTGFEVYNVNEYDFFRNPLEAKKLLIEALEVQPFEQSNVWDGELDGRMVKIMPVDRITTKADLEEIKANLPYKIYEKRKAENPGKPVENITLVCMGHDADLKASLAAELAGYKIDVEVVDILRDRKDLELKREADAEVIREGSKLVIRSFYPLNLMQKLSLQKETVDDWRQLVESVMIDWNFDGVVMEPTLNDVPDKKEFVAGIYDIPADAGTIRVKITDALSESLEVEVN